MAGSKRVVGEARIWKEGAAQTGAPVCPFPPGAGSQRSAWAAPQETAPLSLHFISKHKGRNYIGDKEKMTGNITN